MLIIHTTYETCPFRKYRKEYNLCCCFSHKLKCKETMNCKSIKTKLKASMENNNVLVFFTSAKTKIYTKMLFN